MNDISSNILNFLAKSKYNYGYDYSVGVGGAFLAFFFWFLMTLFFYVYGSIVVMLIAKKTNTSNAWMAWIPILNLYLLCRAAGKSIIWFIMFFFPFINIVAMVIVWSAIAEKRGKPGWWGLLMLVPVANIVIPAILAFGGGFGSILKNKKGDVCSKCGVSVSGSEKFCPECGGKVAKGQSDFCSKCGAKVKSSDKFCPECGVKT